MNFYLRLWLLTGFLLIVGHCQEEGDHQEAEMPEGGEGEGEEGEMPGGGEEGEMPEEGEGEEGEMPGEGDMADGDAEEGDVGTDGEGEAGDMADGDPGEGDMPDGDAEEGDAGVDGDGEAEDADPEGIYATGGPTAPMKSEHMHALFKKMDANGNGKLSLADISVFAQTTRHAMEVKMFGAILADIDTDKDGKVNLTEYLQDEQDEEIKKDRRAEFKRADTNADEFLDSDELALEYGHHINAKVEDVLTSVVMKEKDKDQDGKLSLAEWIQAEAEDPWLDDEKNEFTKIDVDGSGLLTLDELKAWESGSFATENAVKALFAIADKDKDNIVTIEELDAAREEAASHESDAHMYLGMWHDHHNEL